MTKEKVMAVMVSLMDEAYFRPGNPKYTEDNNSYGLTTMRHKHIEISKNEITFVYQGKSGQQHERVVRDKKLARVVRELDEILGQRIFEYFDE